MTRSSLQPCGSNSWCPSSRLHPLPTVKWQTLSWLPTSIGSDRRPNAVQVVVGRRDRRNVHDDCSCEFGVVDNSESSHQELFNP